MSDTFDHEAEALDDLLFGRGAEGLDEDALPVDEDNEEITYDR